MFQKASKNNEQTEITMSRQERAILVLALMSYLIIGIDGSIVITGLLVISADLGLSPEAASWVQNAYVLAFGGLMLLGGRLGDAYGRKSVLNTALVLFGLGSLGAGMSQTATVMIASRFLQGAGAAALAPASLALLIDTFTGQARTRAVAWYGSISGLGLCVGLIVGGAIIGYASWRYGFYVNIPLIALMLWLSWRYVPARKGASRPHFDVAGTLLSVAGIITVVYAIDGAENKALWGISGFVLLAVFVWVESRAAMPVMPLRLFADKTRSVAYIARFLLIAALMGYNLTISEYMQSVFGFSPLQAGCGFIPMTVLTFLTAIAVPRLVERFGNERTAIAGFALLATGFAGLVWSVGGQSYWHDLLLPMSLIGVGQGLAMSPLTNLGIQGVHGDDAGAASGVVNMVHQIGGAVGLSLMTTACLGIDAMSLRFHRSMLIALGCIIVAMFLTTALRLHKNA